LSRPVNNDAQAYFIAQAHSNRAEREWIGNGLLIAVAN
jgi:hypothetical protein